MYEIPTQLLINGQYQPIRNKGDFRMVLDCFETLSDEALTRQEQLVACLIIFYENLTDIYDLSKLGNVETAVKEMFKFFNCGQEQSLGAKASYKLIDWDKDSQIVCSAINKVAGKEIRFEPYIHWWTFMGYYAAVDESVLSTVVGIRYKIMRGEKLEKHEQKFRRDNPQYFVWNHKTVEQREAEELLQQLWNKQ